MYPAFTTPRPRLVSVLSVSQSLERYQAELSRRSPLIANAVSSLEPLDAYVAHLFVNGHPGEPAILDLAAESTGGASTLLALLHPRVADVRALGGPLPGDRRAYRSVVEDFLQREGKSLSALEWLPCAEPSPHGEADTDTILFIHGRHATVDADVASWLNHLPNAIVLVFGLGAIGDCAAIDALLQRFPSGSRRRLVLLRDCGEVLSASRLGMVSDRDNRSAEVALARLKQLFTGNYSFLGLLRTVMEQSIQSTRSDRDILENHQFFLEWNEEINRLKAGSLQSLQRAMRYHLSERLRRWRRRFAPEMTWRYRLFQLTYRAGQIGYREGVPGLLRRIVRRCIQRRA